MLTLDKKFTTYTEVLNDVPRETIAMVDGVPLTVPVEVPAIIPLAYARTIKNAGQDVALAWALDLMLTEDGATALLASGATDDQLGQVIDIVISRVRGATVGAADEAPKASTNGAPTSQKRAATPRGSRAAKNS
jgi:hypothetical protein